MVGTACPPPPFSWKRPVEEPRGMELEGFGVTSTPCSDWLRRNMTCDGVTTDTYITQRNRAIARGDGRSLGGHMISISIDPSMLYCSQCLP